MARARVRVQIMVRVRVRARIMVRVRVRVRVRAKRLLRVQGLGQLAGQAAHTHASWLHAALTLCCDTVFRHGWNNQVTIASSHHRVFIAPPHHKKGSYM